MKKLSLVFACSLIALLIGGEARHAAAQSAQPATVTDKPSTPETISVRATLRGYRGPSQTKMQPAVLVFSPDGQTIAIKTDDFQISLCSALTGECRFKLDSAKSVPDAFAFSPDGRFAAVRYIPNRDVILWNVATGEPQRTPGGIPDAGRLRKSRGLATITYRKEMLPVPFSPDGRYLLTELPDDVTAILNVATNTIEKKLSRDTQLSNKKYAVKSSLLGLFVGGLLPSVIEGGQWSGINSIVTFDRDLMPKLWDATTGNPRGVLAAAGEKIYLIEPSPDGRFIATVDGDGELKLWSGESGEFLATIESERVTIATWSPDSRTLVFARFEKDVRLYDVPGRSERATLSSARSHLTGGRDVADIRGGPQFSPDGRTLATGGKRREAAMIWDAATGKLLYALPKGEDDTQSVAWSPDGSLLVTANDDAATVWNAATGKLIRKLANRARSPVRFSPDGRTLATGARNDTALLWNIATSDAATRETSQE